MYGFEHTMSSGEKEPIHHWVQTDALDSTLRIFNNSSIFFLVFQHLGDYVIYVYRHYGESYIHFFYKQYHIKGTEGAVAPGSFAQVGPTLSRNFRCQYFQKDSLT